jgi:hypothetical protein
MMTRKTPLQTRLRHLFTLVILIAMLGAGLSNYARAGQQTTQNSAASLTELKT